MVSAVRLFILVKAIDEEAEVYFRSTRGAVEYDSFYGRFGDIGGYVKLGLCLPRAIFDLLPEFGKGVLD